MPEQSDEDDSTVTEIVADVFVERQERRVALSLLRAPIQKVAARGKQHLQWRATNAQITWSRERVGRDCWQEWAATLTIYGPHVRSDGTDGKSTHVLDGRRALSDQQWAWVLEATHPEYDTTPDETKGHGP